MTYTFKLARRLAVSRTLALAVFAACSGGDATAPDGSPAHPLTPGSQDDPRFRQTAPLTVSISPSRVTVETNQLIRFLAQGRNSAGDSVGAVVQWSATGGTILPDGRYSAVSTGTFLVIARSPQREQDRVDTSYVEVVRRQIRLFSLEISPGSTTLAPGLSQTFLATGYLQDGHAVPIGATWAATGGTIDAGGNYVAGDTAGTYQVIATHTVLSIADTASVTITAPAPPPPPPAPVPPPPPPAPPALVQVTLRPASATLAPFTTRQFVAFGRTAAGDSVALTSAFTATGGTITGGGLYSAGGTPGTFRVIASSGTLADTSTVVVTAPLGSGPGSGIPVGLVGLIGSNVERGALTMSSDAYTPGSILDRFADARARGVKVLMNMTGGAHSNYLTDGVFDMAKWVARMDGYNTPAIRAAVAAAVADGTIVGNSVMDEPHNTSIANSWGPPGTMTKARVDQMCAYVKNMFPTLPVGVTHDWTKLEPQENYQHCDWLLTQYRLSKGDVVRYRDGGLAFGRRSGVAIIFALNIIHGGVESTTCTKYIRDVNGNLCAMTPEELRSWGQTLGSAGCALNLWRHVPAYFADPAIQSAVRDVANSLANLPRRTCTRP